MLVRRNLLSLWKLMIDLTWIYGKIGKYNNN